MKQLIASTLVLLTLGTSACRASSQIASATEAVAKELVEIMLREGGHEAVTELAQMGGEAAVRELLERAAAEGGEELAERVAQYGSRYGPSALKAIEPSPSRMIRALDGVSPDLVAPAIRAAARQPEVIDRLVAAYGKDALEVAAKNPGVGATLAEKLGVDGIHVGQKLTTDQAITFARYADDIVALPAEERGQLLAAIAKAPAAVLDYLEKHPKVLLTAGGLAALIAAKDNLLGSSVPSPSNDAPPPGLTERLLDRALGRLKAPFMVIIGILVCGILCRVVIRAWSLWKSNAIRLRMEEARAEAEIARRRNEKRRGSGG